jgi:hypothetical protein
MRKFEDAEKAFRMAYERDPDNQELKFWMQRLEENRIDPEKDE